MAELFVLLRDLGDQIAKKGDGTGARPLDNEAVESRFRSVLPNLLEGYLVPSKVKERELMAILKLLSHTVKNYPGVFYRGKGHAVLPILGRIIPLFAEPELSARHGGLFDALYSLVALLKTGEWDTYRIFFVGAMFLVEDIVSVASFYSSPASSTVCTSISLQCYTGAYATLRAISAEDLPPPLCGLPSCWTPPHDPGLLVDVTGVMRWQPLATWTLMLLTRCVSESALLVEGLLTTSFLTAVGALLSYGDAHLQKVCFDLVRAAAAVMDADAIPSEKLILSLFSILSFSDGQLPPFRTSAYDASLGACLTALYAASHSGTVERTAQTLLDVLPQTIKHSLSLELKVALCDIYAIIIKRCPSYSEHVSALLPLAYVPEIVDSVSNCIQLALATISAGSVAEKISSSEEGSPIHDFSGAKPDESNALSKGDDVLLPEANSQDNAPRNKDIESARRKKRKLSGGRTDQKAENSYLETSDAAELEEDPSVLGGDGQSIDVLMSRLLIEQESVCSADLVGNGLMQMMNTMGPMDDGMFEDISVENRLAALHVLVKVIINHPIQDCNQRLIQLFQNWVPWILKKNEKKTLERTQFFMFLEALDCLLARQPGQFADSEEVVRCNHLEIFCCNSGYKPSALLEILMLPWVSADLNQDEILKTKAVVVASKLVSGNEGNSYHEVADHALADDNSHVQASAVLAIPAFSRLSSPAKLHRYCVALISCADQSSVEVREAVAQVLGAMACICNLRNVRMIGVPESLQNFDEFLCPECDKAKIDSKVSLVSGPESGDCERKMASVLILWQPLLSALALDDASDRVQVACISSLSRLLQHASAEELFSTGAFWLSCLDILPLHEHQAVREAFCSQVQCFFSSHVLQGLLRSDDESVSDSDRELEMLGKLRDALAASESSETTQSLLETVAEVAKVAHGRRHLLFFSLVLLLERLDHGDVSLRAKSISLIHQIASSGFSTASGSIPQAMVDAIRDELFEYLVSRLVARPEMVQEFSVSIMRIELKELLKQMVPVILPKLVQDQQRSQLALDTLHELAVLLETDLGVLLIHYCHQILSVLLLQADGEQLSAALQFIEAQTEVSTSEIFAGVLPALLDELVRFLGDVDNDDGLRRSARVVPMMQEVASIVTGSDDLPNFLRPYFVGILNSIDRKLLRSADDSFRIKGLRCIVHLVDMIGPHLCSFVPKIMALLTQTLQEPILQEEGLRVWLSFVRTLARVSSTHLKNVACQIVVSLTPCLEGQPAPHLNAVVEILEEIVIKNRRLLEGQARELPLLPSIPALERVNSVLHEARGLLSLRDQLKQATEGLRHESLSVRYMTASELNVVLCSHRKEIALMMIGEDTLDADVSSRLVTALMRGCVEESRTPMNLKLRMACALCLGELGAVDPVKLQVDLRRRSRIERSDEDLVFELITEHLAPVLRAASETNIQDNAAFAIQELLKLHGCQAAASLTGRRLGPGTGAGRIPHSRSGKPNTILNEFGEASAMTIENGDKLWQRFPDDVKEIITPCLTSKFRLNINNNKLRNASQARTIFRPGMEFRKWMYLWIKRLISQTSGRRAEIFPACGAVVKFDMGTALYILPYLVLNVVCDGSEEDRAGVTQEILTVLKTDEEIKNEDEDEDDEIGNSIRTLSGPSEVSTQTVFTLLDNLGQWLDDCKQGGLIAPSLPPASTTPSKGTRGSAKAEAQQESIRIARRLENVSQLLAAIPKQSLAGASFRCQAYARALLYFESYVREKSGALNPAAEKSGCFTDEDVTFLLDIYSGLEEPDGLSGISRLRKCATLQDQILINEKAGNWGEALTCCEQALQIKPRSVTRHLGVLDCLLNMGHLQAMVTHVDGLNSRMPNHTKEWSTKGLQAAWRLGQWDLLEEYVKRADENSSTNSSEGISFDLSLAKILQALQRRDDDEFSKHLLHCRETLLAPLGAASMESYSRAYPYVVRLHMLQELEDFSALVSTDAGGTNNSVKGQRKHPYLRMEELVEDWESRLKITQPSLWTREPILALRRLVFNETGLPDEVGVCWLQYAKLCREAGHYETASRAILQAQSVRAPNARMEMAKLLWDTQKCHRAIAELQQALSNLPTEVLGEATGAALGGLLVTQSAVPQVAPGLPKSSSRPPSNTQVRRDKELDVAKILLLLARWVHHTGQKQKKDVLSLYSQVRGLKPQWEKGYFSVAKYYDDLLVDARRRQEESQDGSGDSVSKGKQKRHASADDPWWSYLPDALLFYAKGLHKGHRCLFQALPRLLTLWFEFGTHFRGDALATKHVKTVFGRTMSIMRGCLKDLPAYQWLTALSQLVSRICHQNELLVQLVKQIIIYVLQVYPQQALWTMAAVSKSTVAARREAAAEIIQQAKNDGATKDKPLFHQFAVLIDQMMKLSFYPGQAKAKTVNIQSEFSTLKRMMPVGVIMPLQKALTVSLPADGLSNTKYNPFPAGDYPTISGIMDEVEILASLQRPKKVVLLGSDGTEHPFLCKPKDDLRKDARMMEFTTMINRLLSKDAKSRRRKLYVRTFAVIPLTEDCGMIEWVLHTRGLRHILQDIYVAAGKFDRQKTNPLIKRLYDQQGAQGEAEVFQHKVLPMFPPVFHRWFLNMFPEPAAWFRARIAYAHTTAVWSMVGHIVGLGDRHGENILFDSTTGDCVHVDFSCLFDKGLSLEKPEVVPFRLTQNMVDGLGITGYEGVFLRVCEITLGILRAHRETLVSVLETFIHDPLVEWTKSHKSSGVEVQNPHAQRAIANIEARLQGVVVGVGAAPSLPLSVEGQAHRLIAEAVSHSNLSKMYIWWMAWF